MIPPLACQLSRCSPSCTIRPLRVTFNLYSKKPSVHPAPTSRLTSVLLVPIIVFTRLCLQEPLTVPGGSIWIIPFDIWSYCGFDVFSAVPCYRSSVALLVGHTGAVFDVFHRVGTLYSQQSKQTGLYIHQCLWWLIHVMLPCLLQLFLENLEHEDSFVYLSAIQGNVMCRNAEFLFISHILSHLWGH